MNLDIFGVPLNIGDIVAYTTGAQGNESIELGTIYLFGERRGHPVAYLTSSRGRKLSNPRLCKYLVSSNPVRIQHPELFV